MVIKHERNFRSKRFLEFSCLLIVRLIKVIDGSGVIFVCVVEMKALISGVSQSFLWDEDNSHGKKYIAI